MPKNLIHELQTIQKNINMQKDSINPCVLNAEYAVRGEVPAKAQQIANQIRENPTGHGYPFNELIECNIGNPQLFRQPPISYNRRVLSCLLNPQLLKDKSIGQDAKKRAQLYLSQMISAGCYTASPGVPLIRKSIAQYISRHDSVPVPPTSNIFLTEGASQGVHLIIQMLITNQNDGVMIPIPQYPLYSASVVLNGGSIIPYYLNEEMGWQLDQQETNKSYEEATKNGKKVKAIVVINPGNPTGAIFNADTIKRVIQFANKHNIILIADEVYRQNIYKEGAQFLSFRKVLHEMGDQYDKKLQLISLHSISKGFLGECGLRGGYMEIHNFTQSFHQQLIKLKSVFLCSNSIGQCMVQMMVNPPTNDPNASPQTKKQYEDERNKILDSLKNRAKIVTTSLNKMRNIKCQQVEGAMYAFPNIHFSKKAIEASNGNPDLFYCMEVLKNTGIVLVPGTGFKQKEGTHHFRITTLIRPEEKLERAMAMLHEFNEKFHAKYD